MPILRVDQFGKLYESSPDREDGLGYGRSPEVVEVGDLTLGAAYLKSGEARRNSVITSRRNQAVQDHRDEREAYLHFLQKQKARAEEANRAKIWENPKIREEMVKRAALSGCSCDYATPMSGNVMSANGQSGWNGMTRDQQVIHRVANGTGKSGAYQVDPMEQEQHRMREEAQRILHLKARR